MLDNTKLLLIFRLQTPEIKKNNLLPKYLSIIYPKSQRQLTR